VNTFFKGVPDCSPEREAIRSKCFHPTGTFVEFSPEEVDQSIARRFERIVSQHPDRIAVKYKDKKLTYADLNKTANGIAHTILDRRGEKEEPVVLLYDHGVDVIAAIMGVLKAGKFFVALDSQDPIARNLSALKESRAELILTYANNESLVKGFGEADMQVLHTDCLPPNRCSQNPELHIAPSALTYVGYTSGSTGVPKGVMQTHRNLLQQTMVYTNTVHVCVDDHLTLLHSCNNGASTPHLFSALLNGATLLPFDARTEETRVLVRWLTQEGITIYHSVSALFREFTEILTGSEDFSTIRIVHLSGDTVTKKDLGLYKKHFSPDCIFVNRLGSREANTVLLGLFDKSSESSESILPIGPTVEGKGILLLGDNNEPVEDQSVGEIVIKSRYLSPGYWRDPEQTGAAFECPAGVVDGRLYRTGDLGRLLIDGRYQHLGRKDSRVKVRGHRIELAEIEIALLNLPTIKESAVLTWELPNGDVRLIAYVVSDHQPVSTSRELRQLLRETLPDYMIPATIMFLDRLPRTPNGKLDRRAIPPPSNRRPELDIPYVEPKTLTEKQLSQIWTEILSLDQVGIHDSFFDLGGHSLAATRVVSQILRVFQVEVPLQSLFQAPTIADLAKLIETIRWTRQVQQGSIESKNEREQGDL
jgi:amino acid adenylation domain-containing protein